MYNYVYKVFSSLDALGLTCSTKVTDLPEWGCHLHNINPHNVTTQKTPIMFSPPHSIANIWYVKLVPYAEGITGEYQGGFRRKRSTFDQTLYKCWEENADVHRLFIVFQAAYYTVRRKEIWSEMHKLGFTK
jgi:hypothetical protein